MDPLRLILLFLGLAVIAGIYLRYRDPKSSADETLVDNKSPLLKNLKELLPSRKAETQTRIGPEISLEDVESLGTFKVHGSEPAAEELEAGMHVGWDYMTPVAPEDECIMVFNILAKPGEQFTADEVLTAAASSGFELGDMNVFHYRPQNLTATGAAVCSFANVLEPGHFADIESSGFATPGISLFARLPGPLEAREAFKLTLDKAHELASSLGGILCDETRSILSEQTVSHIKEKVEAFRFKQQMAAMKQRRHER